jgi:TetR/AcrR family transcriptional repressor of mexJK operon
MKSTKATAGGRGAQAGAAAAKRGAGKTAAARRDAPRAGRPTSAELERRKAKVMQVATSLFVQHGYAATSLVDIAKAASVATRTLYQHFGDKEAIFLEVLTARESGAVYPQPSIEEDPTLFEAFMHVARYICDVSFRPRSVDLMRLMIAESRRFPDFMRTLSGKTFARFTANVAGMLDEISRRKLAPPFDSAASAALFSDLILGSMPLMVYAGLAATRPTDEELEAKVELFILGRFGPEVAASARGSAKAGVAIEAPAKVKPARKTAKT